MCSPGPWGRRVFRERNWPSPMARLNVLKLVREVLPSTDACWLIWKKTWNHQQMLVKTMEKAMEKTATEIQQQRLCKTKWSASDEKRFQVRGRSALRRGHHLCVLGGAKPSGVVFLCGSCLAVCCIG